jgi:hypothetical protein
VLVEIIFCIYSLLGAENGSRHKYRILQDGLFILSMQLGHSSIFEALFDVENWISQLTDQNYAGISINYTTITLNLYEFDRRIELEGNDTGYNARH